MDLQNIAVGFTHERDELRIVEPRRPDVRDPHHGAHVLWDVARLDVHHEGVDRLSEPSDDLDDFGEVAGRDSEQDVTHAAISPNVFTSS